MSKLSNKHKWIKCFRCILMILVSLAFHNYLFSQLVHDFKVNQDTGLSIAKYDSKISSKIYDLRGREIQTLVNENLNAGTYSTRFNGEGLSSGVYFYSSFTDNKLIDTKKLITIK